jgi:hypothetical protein
VKKWRRTMIPSQKRFHMQEARRRKKVIQSRCSVKKMYQLMDGFGEEKRQLVKEMDFTGILDIPYVTRSNRGFWCWLYRHVDEAASAISIGLRRDIVFNASDFGKIIGIPCGGSPICSDPEKDVVATVRKILGISARENKINAIGKIVTKVHDKEMTKKETYAFFFF